MSEHKLKLIAHEIEGVKPLVYTEEELAEFRKTNHIFKKYEFSRCSDGTYITLIEEDGLYKILILLAYNAHVPMITTKNARTKEAAQRLFDLYIKDGVK